jgi:hypothetical protein
VTPSVVAVRDAKRGTKGGKKKRKRCLQWPMAVANNDNDNDKKADDSGVGCITTAVHSSKRLARPPTDHIERLLKGPARTMRTPLSTTSRIAA